MVDIKLEDDDTSLVGRFERYKNVLLQNLFHNERMPDINGHLMMKDGRKSWMWKKYYFVLRPTGLYYSNKGTSKEPQHLVLFSDLSDVNIYTTLSAKKLLGAPKSHCFCLKGSHHNDVKDFKLMCTEDEQTRLCWITALRLVKYGSQLRENFKAALKLEDKLQKIENKDAVIPGKEPVSVKSRVAMDFTGPGGRVVADPNEALNVALEEAHHWRKKVSSRPVPSHSPLSGSPKACSLLSENPSANRTGMSSGLHMAQPWFHSGISREQAVSLITRQGLVDGVFLVRDSHTMKGAYVLSLAHNQKVKHCQIMQIELDGQMFVSLDGGHTKFSDLLQLVEFYQINAGGLPTTLSYYVTRLL